MLAPMQAAPESAKMQTPMEGLLVDLPQVLQDKVVVKRKEAMLALQLWHLVLRGACLFTTENRLKKYNNRG
jgi:hypothetical protein